jgi:anti-sigma factor RsiW
MTTYMSSIPHLDDAELVRLLDYEHAPDERARWEAHIEACARCAGAVDRLQADAAVVRVWLERAAFEQPAPRQPALHGGTGARVRRRHAKQWLRAAAVLALVAMPVTAIAAIPTLRAWVVAAFGDLRRDEVADLAPGAATDAVSSADRIRFVPAAGNFTVQLDAEQAAGTLRVAHGSDATALLDRAGTGAVVSESTLRIRNTPDAALSYVLHVPVAVTSVTVRIGTRTIAVLDAGALRAGTDIPIRPR